MIIIERIKELIAQKEMSETSFSKLIGVSQRTLNNYMNGRTPSLEIIDAILSAFPEVSAEWLLRGEGNMLKSNNNLIGSNQGNDNTIEYNNGGNVGVGNTVNVSLPEAGTQKIISPDGKVEINQFNSSVKELEHKIEMLETEVSHLNNNIETKDKLIASLERTIELLGHRQ
ncbi:helix-turn-helix domain-containing protein [Bacteroides timonensis]|uniref:helix-turn-helix domain-containing protein n=1 Tax=Bacteroides timonensis TaxID=1470345 RepID=UPI0004B202FF|nr:helix-turn-helix transcriptional regulator [Bacteroides timonensis]